MDTKFKPKTIEKNLDAQSNEFYDSQKDGQQPLIRKIPEVAKLYVVDNEAVVLKRNMRNKLKFAANDLKEYYNKVKNCLMSYKGVKCRMSNVSENFRLKRKLIAKITLAGNNLKLFLALDPSQYPENIYHQKDMGNMDLYQFVPFMVRLRTKLSSRKACKLIDDTMLNFSLKLNPKYVETDYIATLSPDENEVLAKSRSVTLLRENELVSSIDDYFDDTDYYGDEVASDISVEKLLIRKVPEVAKLYVVDDEAVVLKRNMRNKLKFAADDLKEYYNKVKNCLMSYKGVKCRMSNVSENFRLKRKLIAKITLAGNNLKLFLALNPSQYPENIYHQKDMGNMDLYQFVPFMVRLRTKLSSRKACKLIDDAMQNFGLKLNPKYFETDYIASLSPDENEVLAKSRSVVTVRKSEIVKGLKKTTTKKKSYPTLKNQPAKKTYPTLKNQG